MQSQRQSGPQRSSSTKAVSVRDYTARKVTLVIALALMSYIAMLPILHRLSE
ncbi:MAG: hypothetical protein J0L82_00745 [Deltaproteobacteria bacterium]|nr:hypothetical protein [Deltaproteobacteria bacterium]